MNITFQGPMKFLLSALLLVLCGQLFAADLNDGVVSISVGNVTLIPAGGGVEKPLKVGDAVPVGSVVKTGPASRTVIKTTKQSAVRIAENSQAVFTSLVDSDAAPKVLIDLKAGSLGALIQPQAQAVMDFKKKQNAHRHRGSSWHDVCGFSRRRQRLRQSRARQGGCDPPERAKAAATDRQGDGGGGQCD
jgi:hypothetical protein